MVLVDHIIYRKCYFVYCNFINLWSISLSLNIPEVYYGYLLNDPKTFIPNGSFSPPRATGIGQWRLNICIVYTQRCQVTGKEGARELSRVLLIEHKYPPYPLIFGIFLAPAEGINPAGP